MSHFRSISAPLGVVTVQPFSAGHWGEDEHFVAVIGEESAARTRAMTVFILSVCISEGVELDVLSWLYKSKRPGCVVIQWCSN